MTGNYITIFTPAYNRQTTLERLFKSLVIQTNKNFEWIVIDDGSTDNTENFFNKIKETPIPFSLTYLKKKNGGKHRAINDAVKLAKGELFFIVDSDDYLTENAIEQIFAWQKSLDNSHHWAGVAGLRGYSEQKAIGQAFSSNFVDAKNTERRKYHLESDKAEIYFTEILKKYPFPEIDGENFISEEIVWNSIAHDGYYLRWFSSIIYICEYRDDGLTYNRLEIEKKNPQGLLLWSKNQIKVFSEDYREKVFAIFNYYQAVKDNKNLSQIACDLAVSKLYLICAILSFKIAKAIH